nr:MAG TPA: hypothetical protein [Caudoviricetes sp.]
MGLQRGCGGLYLKDITFAVGLYSINQRETLILTHFKNVGLHYKVKCCNPLIINYL